MVYYRKKSWPMKIQIQWCPSFQNSQPKIRSTHVWQSLQVLISRLNCIFYPPLLNFYLLIIHTSRWIHSLYTLLNGLCNGYIESVIRVSIPPHPPPNGEGAWGPSIWRISSIFSFIEGLILTKQAQSEEFLQFSFIEVH